MVGECEALQSLYAHLALFTRDFLWEHLKSVFQPCARVLSITPGFLLV
jgi:hypothetical protein